MKFKRKQLLDSRKGVILESAEAFIRNVQNDDRLFEKNGKVGSNVEAVLAKYGDGVLHSSLR